MIPYSTTKKLLENENKDLIFSKSAVNRTIDYLEELSKNLIEKSQLLAQNSKRKTIKKEDLEFSYNQLN